MIILLRIITIIYSFCICKCFEAKDEIFKQSSVTDLEDIFRTRIEFSNFLKTYLNEEQNRLKQIKILSEEYERSRFDISENDEKFLENPINIFHLVKRFHMVIKPIVDLMNMTKINDTINNFAQKGVNIIFPTIDDILSITDGFHNIMKFNNYNVSSLIDSGFSQYLSHTNVTEKSCYSIGLFLYDNGEYEKAIPWLKTAIVLDEKHKQNLIKKQEVYEFLAFSYFSINYIKKGLQTIQDYLKIDPTNEEFLDSYRAYSSNLDQIENDDESYEIENNIDTSQNSLKNICSMTYKPKNKNQHMLKCYYLQNHCSYLLLQPIKMEDLHYNPWITVFHDIVKSSAIRVIKHLSKENMVKSHRRLCKSTWLEDNSHPVLLGIFKTLECITGLNIFISSEELQVINYGFGGNYEPHVDFNNNEIKEEYFFLKSTGKRIATLLIYLSEVHVGGETFFTRLNLKIKPHQGSVLFWYNILKNGSTDYMTEHGACPVVIGNKWVANKWIHEYNQEFKRPCGLKPEVIYDNSFNV